MKPIDEQHKYRGIEKRGDTLDTQRLVDLWSRCIKLKDNRVEEGFFFFPFFFFLWRKSHSQINQNKHLKVLILAEDWSLRLVLRPGAKRAQPKLPMKQWNELHCFANAQWLTLSWGLSSATRCTQSMTWHASYGGEVLGYWSILAWKADWNLQRIGRRRRQLQNALIDWTLKWWKIMQCSCDWKSSLLLLFHVF